MGQNRKSFVKGHAFRRAVKGKEKGRLQPLIQKEN